jgi:uncharacterized membrane protein
MNTTVIIILAVAFGLPLVLLVYAFWCLYRDAKEYNDEHDLP